MFQQEQVCRSVILLPDLFFDQCGKVDPRTQKPIPAHADTLWEVEVKTAYPVQNTQETPLSQMIEAVLDVQRLMRGLLDLRRKDV